MSMVNVRNIKMQIFSGYVIYTAAQIASAKEIPLEKVLEQTRSFCRANKIKETVRKWYISKPSELI